MGNRRQTGSQEKDAASAAASAGKQTLWRRGRACGRSDAVRSRASLEFAPVEESVRSQGSSQRDNRGEALGEGRDCDAGPDQFCFLWTRAVAGVVTVWAGISSGGRGSRMAGLYQKNRSIVAQCQSTVAVYDGMELPQTLVACPESRRSVSAPTSNCPRGRVGLHALDSTRVIFGHRDGDGRGRGTVACDGRDPASAQVRYLLHNRGCDRGRQSLLVGKYPGFLMPHSPSQAIVSSSEKTT